MKVTIELTPEQLDNVILEGLISQYEDCFTDWILEEDHSYDRKMRKALRKVIKHNSNPQGWRDFKSSHD